jgi:lysophospholipid acyltransferase (LPLAT)-like uncharacterized protein
LSGSDGCHVIGQAHGFSHSAVDLCLLKKKVFSSWDHFQFPFPWSKGLFVWGDPIWVAPHLRKDELFGHGVEFQRVLNTLTEQADLAVQQADPAACFLHAMRQDSSSSIG